MMCALYSDIPSGAQKYLCDWTDYLILVLLSLCRERHLSMVPLRAAIACSQRILMPHLVCHLCPLALSSLPPNAFLFRRIIAFIIYSVSSVLFSLISGSG